MFRMAFKVSKTGQDTESTEFTAFDGEKKKNFIFCSFFLLSPLGLFIFFAVSLSRTLPYCEHD